MWIGVYTLAGLVVIVRTSPGKLCAVSGPSCAIPRITAWLPDMFQKKRRISSAEADIAMTHHQRFPLLATCLFASCLGTSTLTLCPQGAAAQESSTIQVGPTTFSLGVGWEHLRAGGVRWGGTYEQLASPFPLISTEEQHDGQFNGVRLDAALTAPARLFGLPDGLVSFKGFYGWHDASSRVDCTSTSAAASCDGVPLFDPSPAINHTLGSGPGEVATYATDRELRHWGVALEAALSALRIGSLQNRFGIGYRALNQSMTLSSTWSLSDHSQYYTETLDTGYLGAYWGLSGRHSLMENLDFIFSSEAGIYWAHTDYDGALNQRDFSGSYSQHLSLDRDKAAFIGALSLGLERRFVGFTMMGYARGEYYSYAPKMAYNQTDYDVPGYPPSGIALLGPNDGTRIGSTDAWSVTVGLGVKVPLASLP
jgi:hypothetical protein